MDDLIPAEERDARQPHLAVMAVQIKPKWQLQKLTKRHRDIASLLISGVTHDEIADVCNCHKQTIIVLKQQPIFQDYLKQLQQEIEDEFKGLFGRTVRAIRDSLQDDAPRDTRLKAARIVLEAQGRLKGVNTGQESAEDVARRLIQNFNVQINVGGER